MRWFRRQAAEPPPPAAPEPKPVVVDVEPAAESTATIPPKPAPPAHSPASETVLPKREPERAPAATADDTVPEPAVTYVPELRHWHRAEGGMRLPAARPPGTTRVAPRVESDGWHRA